MGCTDGWKQVESRYKCCIIKNITLNNDLHLTDKSNYVILCIKEQGLMLIESPPPLLKGHTYYDISMLLSLDN